MMTDYKMIGNDLFDYRSQKLGYVRGADLYDTHTRKVGMVRDYEIYDDRYTKVASIRGYDVFDEHGIRIISLQDIKNMIDNPPSGAILVALWWFFIRKV
jgi:hypothetical protein